MIWFPLPGLERQLIALCERDRQAGLEAIQWVASSFRQGWAARRAILELVVGEIARARTAEAIAALPEKLAWLPDSLPAELEDILPPLREVAARVRAALQSETSYNKRRQLDGALRLTQQVRQLLGLEERSRLAPLFGPALKVWEDVLVQEINRIPAEFIPNPYVAGAPLATASKVFKGRRDIFRALERELTRPGQRPTLLLFGPRRSGKTSVLMQLPEALGPDVVPVFIDLQSAAVAEDAAGLFAFIARQIALSAAKYREISLEPPTREALSRDTYLNFQKWLTDLEEAVGNRWVLLALDEYEYLGRMLEDGRIDERAFQLLRGVIQNHPRITVLLSGAHTLEDLPPFWSNYFINVRLLKVGPLKRSEARELIVQPIENFPLVYYQGGVDRILEMTDCRPYLIQATCCDLVNKMDEEHRAYATRADVAYALRSVLISASGYFSELWNGPDSDKAQRVIMEAIARARRGVLNVGRIEAALIRAGFERSQVADIRRKALRSLRHRDILFRKREGYAFRVELVRRWIRQHLGLR